MIARSFRPDGSFRSPGGAWSSTLALDRDGRVWSWRLRISVIQNTLNNGVPFSRSSLVRLKFERFYHATTDRNRAN